MTRKVILALMIVLSAVSMSSGAASEDMSVYVRKDVFEVHMQNINTNMEKILEELKAQRKDITELSRAVSVLSTRVDGLEAKMDTRINGLERKLDVRIDDLRNGLYLWITVITVIFAYIEIRRKRQEREDAKEATAPTMTLEEIKNLVGQMIAENNAKLIKSR